MMWYYGWGMPMWVGMGMMLLFWVALILLVVWVVRAARPPEPPRASTPLELLRRRYALGEISKDDYEAAKRTLDEPAPTPR